MIEEMRKLAFKTLEEQENSNTQNFKIGFHKPFTNSIDHLHMHAFELPHNKWYGRYIKYKPFFFILASEIIEKSNIIE